MLASKEKESILSRASILIWCLGFSLITFDLVLCWKVGPFTVKSFHLLFLVSGGLAVLSGENKFRQKIDWKRIFFSPLGFLAAFVVYCFFSATYSILPLKTLGYSGLGVFNFLFILLLGAVHYQSQGEKFVKLLFQFLYASLWLLGAVVLIDYFAFLYGYRGGLIGFNQARYLDWGMSRPHAFAHEPSYLCHYVSLVLVFLFTDIAGAKNKRGMLLFKSTTVLWGAMILLLAASRTGWIMTTLEVLAVSLWTLKKTRFSLFKIMKFAAGTLVALTLFSLLLPKDQKQKLWVNSIRPILTLHDGPGNARLLSITGGARIAKATHFLGTGLGGSYLYWIQTVPNTKAIFEEMNGKITSDVYGREAIMSTYPQVFAETGIIGLLLYLGFVIGTLAFVSRDYRKNPSGFNFSRVLSCCLCFFLSVFTFGNVMRPDMWVWYSVWHFYLFVPKSSKESASTPQAVN